MVQISKRIDKQDKTLRYYITINNVVIKIQPMEYKILMTQSKNKPLKSETGSATWYYTTLKIKNERSCKH